ncbi:NAD-binding protein [Phycisphaerales bacterium AB-hyl4]|uniref:NAD-binding protein n=1 Tax=Natronomicrosphaera hydrolytica TaxID=3242702 RepID=A0ABV4U0H0_9BACT
MNQSHSSQPVGDASADSTTSRPIDLPGRRAIVVGFGVVGRMTAERLRNVGVNVTLIELNSTTTQRQADLDRQVVLGDATDPKVLQQAGLNDADALILTLPDADDTLRACRVARQLNPDIFIAVRVNFVSQAMLATQAGADQTIIEEVVTAQAMQQAVVNQLTQ